MRKRAGDVHDNRWLLAGLALLAALALGACGDDDGSGDDDSAGSGEPSGEECSPPGRTETGCTCTADRPPGSRHCDDDGTWSACVCPNESPAQNGCERDGDRIRCNLCPGETEHRFTTCQDNRFDCSCGGGGSGDAGMRDAAVDGG